MPCCIASASVAGSNWTLAARLPGCRPNCLVEYVGSPSFADLHEALPIVNIPTGGFEMSERLTGNTPISNSETPKAKRPYQKPSLTRLGTLRDVTMQKSYGKSRDGGRSKYNNKTGRGGVQAIEPLSLPHGLAE
jgi:hypothetical protein